MEKGNGMAEKRGGIKDARSGKIRREEARRQRWYSSEVGGLEGRREEGQLRDGRI